jgi:hypothetical protein
VRSRPEHDDAFVGEDGQRRDRAIDPQDERPDGPDAEAEQQDIDARLLRGHYWEIDFDRLRELCRTPPRRDEQGEP